MNEADVANLTDKIKKELDLYLSGCKTSYGCFSEDLYGNSYIACDIADDRGKVYLITIFYNGVLNLDGSSYYLDGENNYVPIGKICPTVPSRESAIDVLKAVFVLCHLSIGARCVAVIH